MNLRSRSVLEYCAHASQRLWDTPRMAALFTRTKQLDTIVHKLCTLRSNILAHTLYIPNCGVFSRGAQPPSRLCWVEAWFTRLSQIVSEFGRATNPGRHFDWLMYGWDDLQGHVTETCKGCRSDGIFKGVYNFIRSLIYTPHYIINSLGPCQITRILLVVTQLLNRSHDLYSI